MARKAKKRPVRSSKPSDPTVARQVKARASEWAKIDAAARFRGLPSSTWLRLAGLEVAADPSRPVVSRAVVKHGPLPSAPLPSLRVPSYDPDA